MKRDIKSNINTLQALTPLLRTATVNGASIDTRDYGSCAFVLNPGAITDGTFTPKLEESDNASDWNDVAADDQQGTFAAATANTVQKVGYVGGKRYVRITITVTGSPSTGGNMSAVAVLGHAHQLPVGGIS